jgi:hypothetical protein
MVRTASAENTREEPFKVARTEGWRGYLGSPRLARASDGARPHEYRSARDNALALAILEGRIGEREVPRYSQKMTAKEIVSALAAANQNDVNRERKQPEWMTRKESSDVLSCCALPMRCEYGGHS